LFTVKIARSLGLRASTAAMVLLAALGSVTLSCKPKTSTARTASIARPITERIVGKWESDCLVLPSGRSRKVNLTVTKIDMLYVQHEFFDAQCLQLRNQVSSTAPYAGSQKSQNEDVIEIVMQPRSMVAKPVAPAEIQRLNAEKICGSEYWQAGAEKNVSMTACGDVMLALPPQAMKESLVMTPAGKLILGTSGIELRRIAVAFAPTAYLDGAPPRPHSRPQFTLEDYKNLLAGKPTGARVRSGSHSSSSDTTVLSLGSETFVVQPCSDNPKEACGKFTEAMRTACAYCKGGIDTCQQKERWDLGFATNIAEQLKTRPPAGVCSPDGTAGTRDPQESHDALSQAMDAEVAGDNNALLADPQAPPPSSDVNAPAAQQQAMPAAAAPVASVSAQEAQMKQRKVGVAQFVGNVVPMTLGLIPGCGFWCSTIVGAVATPALTHGTGQLLDRFLPTRSADAAAAAEKLKEKQEAEK